MTMSMPLSIVVRVILGDIYVESRLANYLRRWGITTKGIGSSTGWIMAML